MREGEREREGERGGGAKELKYLRTYIHIATILGDCDFLSSSYCFLRQRVILQNSRKLP